MQKYDELNAEIGARIKESRLNMNISQDVLAEKINVCNGTHVSNIERGYCGISIKKLISICKTLNVSSDYILFGISSNNVESSLHRYIKQLTNEQSVHLMNIILSYIKSCGIDE